MHVAARVGLIGLGIVGAVVLAGCGRSEQDGREEEDSVLQLLSKGIQASTNDELSRSEVDRLARVAHMVPEEEYFEAGKRMGAAYVELEPTVGTAAAVEGAQFVGAFPDVSPETYAAAFENLETVVGDELEPTDIGHVLMRYQIYSEEPMTPEDGTAIGRYLAPGLDSGAALEELADHEMVSMIDHDQSVPAP